MDISVIGNTSVSTLAENGSVAPASFQLAVEGYAGARLEESLGPVRFWKRSLGGVYVPSTGITRQHQTHLHFESSEPMNHAKNVSIFCVVLLTVSCATTSGVFAQVCAHRLSVDSVELWGMTTDTPALNRQVAELHLPATKWRNNFVARVSITNRGASQLNTVRLYLGTAGVGWACLLHAGTGYAISRPRAVIVLSRQHSYWCGARHCYSRP